MFDVLKKLFLNLKQRVQPVSVEEIQPLELRSLLEDQQHKLLLIDVREPDENQRVRIGDSSWLIPMASVEGELDAIRSKSGDADTTVVYCRSGGRSEMAIRWLEQAGISGLKNLRGGINAYAKEADTSLEPY